MMNGEANDLERGKSCMRLGLVVALIGLGCLAFRGEGQGRAVASAQVGGGTWAQGCDIRIRDGGGNRDTIEVLYQADTSSETVTVQLTSTRDVDIDHPALSGPTTLTRNTPYVIEVSELKLNVTAKLKITPGILPTATEFTTFGPKSETVDEANAYVYAKPDQNGATVLWVSLNKRHTAFWIGASDVDVEVKDLAIGSTKHTLDIEYLADTTNEELLVHLLSNKPLGVHHPRMTSSKTLAAGTTYDLKLSNVNPSMVARLEITPSTMSQAAVTTLGPHVSTGNGAVRLIQHDKERATLWMSINGRSVGVHLVLP